MIAIHNPDLMDLNRISYNEMFSFNNEFVRDCLGVCNVCNCDISSFDRRLSPTRPDKRYGKINRKSDVYIIKNMLTMDLLVPSLEVLDGGELNEFFPGVLLV